MLTRHEAKVKQYKKWEKVLNDTELNHLHTELLYQLNTWNEYFKDRVLADIGNVWLLVFSNKGLKKINYGNNKDYKDFYSETKLFALGGYILLYPTVKKAKYDFIDVCDTVFSNLQLLQLMIKHIEKRKRILPLHIIKSSAGYWRKYLKLNYYLETNNDIETFLTTVERECDWEVLFTNEC